MNKRNVKKSIITSLTPKKRLTEGGIVGHSGEMNQRIEKTLRLMKKNSYGHEKSSRVTDKVIFFV